MMRKVGMNLYKLQLLLKGQSPPMPFSMESDIAQDQDLALIICLALARVDALQLGILTRLDHVKAAKRTRRIDHQVRCTSKHENKRQQEKPASVQHRLMCSARRTYRLDHQGVEAQTAVGRAYSTLH